MLEEISNFSSIYFADHVRTLHNPISRYNVDIETNAELSLFKSKGDTTCKAGR
jgi:hypothetical protein